MAEPSALTAASEPAPADVKRARVSWWAWDFGATALNSVMISFVFSVYVTGTVSGDPARGQTAWSDAQTIAGIALALLAPMMGAWADRARNRRGLLGLMTGLMIAATAACFFVRPVPEYLALGVILLSVAAIVQEIGGVFYNGMLLKISTQRNIGRVSAIGWGGGYGGGVLMLVVVLFGFVLNGGAFGVPRTDLLNIRSVALLSAAFMLVFCTPLILWGPKDAPVGAAVRFSPLRAYGDIGRRLVRMWRHERGLLHFLIASAVFRDGLTAVFSFGGVIAATSFGFSQTEVIIFGVAANVIALVGTWALSGLDDRLGPRWVIIGCLVVMILAGIGVVVLQSKIGFWVCGLIISSMVGLVQSASRTLLARLAPAGEENETFGLYATTGRVASFIAPLLVGLCTRLFGVEWGILGIILTLVLGLAIFATLRVPGITHDRAPHGVL